MREAQAFTRFNFLGGEIVSGDELWLSATPDAANYVDKNYSSTGQIQFPVITLHTDQDPLLPLFHEEICTQTEGGVSTFGNEY